MGAEKSQELRGRPLLLLGAPSAERVAPVRVAPHAEGDRALAHVLPCRTAGGGIPSPPEAPPGDGIKVVANAPPEGVASLGLAGPGPSAPLEHGAYPRVAPIMSRPGARRTRLRGLAFDRGQSPEGASGGLPASNGVRSTGALPSPTLVTMAETGEPLVRGSHLKEDLEALAALGADVEARVRLRLRAESVAAIEEATRIEYLPLAHNIAMADAVFAEAGEGGSRLWGKSSLLASIGGVFRPLFEGLTALFNPAPTLLFKYIPKGWAVTYRECGEFVVDQPRVGTTLLRGRGLASEMLRPAFLFAVCGTFEAAFALSRYEGTVRCLSTGRNGPDVEWLVDWRRL